MQSITYEAFDTEVAKHPALFLLLRPENEAESLVSSYIIGNTKSSNALLQRRVLKASRALFGTPPVYAATSPAFYERFNLKPGSSAVLSLKDFDRTSPAGIYHLEASGTVEDLSNWVRPHSLTSSLSYKPSPSARQKPSTNEPRTRLRHIPRHHVRLTQTPRRHHRRPRNETQRRLRPSAHSRSAVEGPSRVR